MVDINNENMIQNHTFIQQMHMNDDTNMTTNDFDRYARHDCNVVKKNRRMNTL